VFFKARMERLKLKVQKLWDIKARVVITIRGTLCSTTDKQEPTAPPRHSQEAQCSPTDKDSCFRVCPHLMGMQASKNLSKIGKKQIIWVQYHPNQTNLTVFNKWELLFLFKLGGRSQNTFCI